MKLILIAAAIAALTPTFAQAAIVNLQCSFPVDTQTVTMDVTLNEAAGTVDYTLTPGGESQRAPGMFAANEVQFRAFFINRTTLDFERRMTLGARSFVDHGKCKLVTPPSRRAF